MNSSRALARLALAAGVLVAPIFYLTVFTQAATREGYSVSRVALSLLSLGDEGWIQITNFIVCGLLALISVVGFRAVLAGHRGGVWGPSLVAIYGLGLVIAGVWHPDPGAGFPPGTPLHSTAPMSGHYIVHWIGFILVNVSLIASCFFFAWVFRGLGQGGWSIYGVVSAVVGVILVVAGLATENFLGPTFGGLVIYSFLSAVSGRLLALTPTASARPGERRVDRAGQPA
ncbi:DUF998 domain-containing protein [Amycolatopsis mediterranei]|uniref:DUF998 domain-containing protein n=1 Tax=Amycolatopsis mediterranei TaxID=33910 RepID=UPI0034458208